ncbi:MAG TPA: hypothetical protein VFW07_07455 [Parafilimonas sp.]|nr:hypothetical protein [Parafilimonas sp.]
MTLFVFVLAVKALHVHDLSCQKNNNTHQPVNIGKNFFCNICEFQLAKDIDAEITVVDLAAPLIFLHSYYHFTTSFSVSFGKDLPVRGPPSFA